MSRRQLRVHVHVHRSPGETVIFGPGDAVPTWAAEQITNPDVWADDEPDDQDETVDESDDDESDDDESDDDESDDAAAPDTDVPPRTGAGSGKDAWRAYAAQVGVDVDEAATRDEIIAAVEAAGELV